MLLFEIALTLIPGIGDITAKRLIAFCGSAEAVFKEKRQALMKIPGIGSVLADTVLKQNVLSRAERELEYIYQHEIKAHSIHSDTYPERLKHCVDAPLVLFARGPADLNAPITIAVVGTRKSTQYGREACQELVKGLSEIKPLIISGLAYGIDTISHKAALDNGLITVGVMAHGLDRVYPPANNALARKMIIDGALVTDFLSNTVPDRENFPKRNRIIAGLSDAVVVVEAARGGGALITADIANSYNRDVFAVPGRWSDEYSKGCNYLVSTNRAALIQSPRDLMEAMNWCKKNKAVVTQTELMITMSPDEELLYKILFENGETGVDLLCLSSGLSPGRTANALINMELEGIITSLPGKRFKLSTQ
ncbi:MAG: DNA-processing protein DprA [Bacteroidales bacterium]